MQSKIALKALEVLEEAGSTRGVRGEIFKVKVLELITHLCHGHADGDVGRDEGSGRGTGNALDVLVTSSPLHLFEGACIDGAFDSAPLEDNILIGEGWAHAILCTIDRSVLVPLRQRLWQLWRPVAVCVCV